MVVPTLSHRSGPRITLYCYGSPGPAVIADLADDLSAAHSARVQVVHLRSGATESIGAGTGQALRIWLHEFPDNTGTPSAHASGLARAPQATGDAGVYVLGECFGPAVVSFADFAQRMRSDGWQFLREQARRRALGPVLIRMHEDHVVGATGPLQIRPDSIGRRRLLPQYLGVLPEAHRGQCWDEPTSSSSSSGLLSRDRRDRRDWAVSPVMSPKSEDVTEGSCGCSARTAATPPG